MQTMQKTGHNILVAAHQTQLAHVGEVGVTLVHPTKDETRIYFVEPQRVHSAVWDIEEEFRNPVYWGLVAQFDAMVAHTDFTRGCLMLVVYDQDLPECRHFTYEHVRAILSWLDDGAAPGGKNAIN